MGLPRVGASQPPHHIVGEGGVVSLGARSGGGTKPRPFCRMSARFAAWSPGTRCDTHAGRAVAGVHQCDVLRERTVFEFPRHSVGASQPSVIVVEVAVAAAQLVDGAGPDPAPKAGAAVDPLVEPLSRRGFCFGPRFMRTSIRVPVTVHSGRGWRLAPSLIALEDEVNRIWPRRSQASDGSIGDSAHRHRKSDHNPAGGWVTAIDLTNDPRVGLDIHAQMRTLAARGDRRASTSSATVRYGAGARVASLQRRQPAHPPRPHQHRQHARCPQRHVAVAGVDRRQRTRPQPTPQPQPTPRSRADPVPAPLAGGKPMQIVHVPDNPTQVNPDTWWITDGIEARTLAPGEPEWFAMSGLVNQPVIAAGKVRPVPMPWSMFSG